MAFSTFFVSTIAALLLNTLAVGQSCTVQPIFPSGFATPLLCDGDGGGSQFTTIGSALIVYDVLFGAGEPILGFPNLSLPEKIVLSIARFGSGAVDRGQSYIEVEGTRFRFSASTSQTQNFRTWFNVLQVLVRQFETGNCPIDNKAQTFPELASLRGALLSLSSTFKVKDCSGGNTM